jgi:hypothetical protein
MDGREIVRKASRRDRSVRYSGDAFAPARGTYLTADMKTFNFTTQADSGYSPSPIERVADLGSLAPLVLAALWESSFAFEAGPLSTWNN